jgi:hypothetical protein
MSDAMDQTPDGRLLTAPEQRARSTLAGRVRYTLAGGTNNA